jgi:hypothetical protein
MLFKAMELLFYPGGSLLFYDENRELEWITYALYVIALLATLCCVKDFWKDNKKATFGALLFLCLIALLREMGIQHWLTQHDTTAIKIKFFTNPNNPLHEKIISAGFVFIILTVAFWLFFKYLPKMIRGFFNLVPLYWTIATFGGIGIVSQFCDRFPSNYFKATGVQISGGWGQLLKLLEEGGEACLPILFILALFQYHLMCTEK